jgi:hypothetical protein
MAVRTREAVTASIAILLGCRRGGRSDRNEQEGRLPLRPQPCRGSRVGGKVKKVGKGMGRCRWERDMRKRAGLVKRGAGGRVERV